MLGELGVVQNFFDFRFHFARDALGRFVDFRQHFLPHGRGKTYDFFQQSIGSLNDRQENGVNMIKVNYER